MATAYLSEEWAKRLTEGLNADERVKKGIRGQDVVVEMTVTGAPEGDAVYAMRFENGSANVVIGKPDSSHAQATITYENSVAMSKGDLPGQTAVMTGKMAVQGDFERVLRIAGVLAVLPEVSATIDIAY